MYSNSDFENFFLRYKSEAVTSKESIQSFCLRNNVPYNLFEKWYKDTRHKLVPVKVDGQPEHQERKSSLRTWSLLPIRKLCVLWWISVWALAFTYNSAIWATQVWNSSWRSWRFYVKCDGPEYVLFLEGLSWYEMQVRKQVFHEGGELIYSIDWKDVVLLLESPVIKRLKIR